MRFRAGGDDIEAQDGAAKEAGASTGGGANVSGVINGDGGDQQYLARSTMGVVRYEG